ncbi:MAG: glycosyltransferase family 2 protein [Steroidobacteraceae bacterium]
MTVTTFLVYLLCAAAALLLVPATVLFIEVLASAIAPAGASQIKGERPRVAVLMPAHNEASIIAASLRSVLPQLAGSDRLIVIADNCSDETSTIAKSEGAEVIVRTDPTRRGKGFALDFGVRHLEQDPPQVVIVIDADCEVTAGSIDKLARLGASSGRPVQSMYLMHTAAGAGVKMRIAEFAFLVKNNVRPAGLHRLRLPCQLMGTGMAFPWPCIRTAQLATGHIVEDLKLGIELARAGDPPLFCPEALVSSRFASDPEGSQSQRTRWEHGHMSVILSDAPRLLLDSLLKIDLRLAAMALDLSVPPLALLTLLNAAMWIASAILFGATRILLPLAITSVSLGLLGASVVLAWARYGRHIVSLVDLGFAMRYALLKIPLYAKFVVARQLDWVRSKRDDE